MPRRTGKAYLYSTLTLETHTEEVTQKDAVIKIMVKLDHYKCPYMCTLNSNRYNKRGATE